MVADIRIFDYTGSNFLLLEFRFILDFYAVPRQLCCQLRVYLHHIFDTGLCGQRNSHLVPEPGIRAFWYGFFAGTGRSAGGRRRKSRIKLLHKKTEIARILETKGILAVIFFGRVSVFLYTIDRKDGVSNYEF